MFYFIVPIQPLAATFFNKLLLQTATKINNKRW